LLLFLHLLLVLLAQVEMVALALPHREHNQAALALAAQFTFTTKEK
jgi:hypothetical protein